MSDDTEMTKAEVLAMACQLARVTAAMGLIIDLLEQQIDDAVREIGRDRGGDHDHDDC